MSGSGNGGSGIKSQSINCETVGFKAIVNSPRQDVVDQLQVDEVLDVRAQDGRVIVCRTSTDEIVGTINWAHNDQLIQCIEEGHRYSAKVIELDGGVVRVHLFHAGSA